MPNRLPSSPKIRKVGAKEPFGADFSQPPETGGRSGLKMLRHRPSAPASPAAAQEGKIEKTDRRLREKTARSGKREGGCRKRKKAARTVSHDLFSDVSLRLPPVPGNYSCAGAAGLTWQLFEPS